MFRGRDSRHQRAKLVTSVTCLLTFVATSCVFSPVSKPPAPPIGPPGNPEEFIKVLEGAYRTRNYDTFASLLSAETGAEYLFILEPNSPGDHQWGRTEELRIQQRMFRPEDIQPGDPPLNPDLWLVSIDISLTPQQGFTEARTFYRSDSNPEGLDPAVWKAMEAVYNTDVLFDLQGQTDFQVTGRASFVVIENLAKNIGDAVKFLIYRWEDLGTRSKPAAAARPAA